MPRTTFSEMPDDARVWVFGVGRALSAAETAEFMARMDEFLDEWAAHGAPLLCARDFRHGRFLLVSLDESSIPPSGCSIDSMTRLLREVEDHLDTPIVDNTPVWFLDATGDVQRLERAAFKALVEEGSVSPATIVFDNTVTRLGQVRHGEWQRPAHESWHGRAFFRDAVQS
jgi:hypothetical protein